jgi:hypothetical protein
MPKKCDLPGVIPMLAAGMMNTTQRKLRCFGCLARQPEAGSCSTNTERNYFETVKEAEASTGSRSFMNHPNGITAS